MNYYENIKQELINNEIYKKVKDYSKNRSDLQTYYNVGKMLSEAGKHYGEGIIKEYSKKLTNELGKGYNISSLKRMRQFYSILEKGATLSHQLTWSHYVELLIVNNVNIINGLPYETYDMMIDTVKYLSNLDIQGIKIHMLSILKNTKLEELYKKEHFKTLTRDEYIKIVCDQLEYLRPEIVINRITADPKIDDLIEPEWLIKKFCVLNDIDKELVRRDSYQGCKL